MGGSGFGEADSTELGSSWGMEMCGRTKLLSLNPGDAVEQPGDAAGSGKRCGRGLGLTGWRDGQRGVVEAGENLPEGGEGLGV